MNIITKQQIMTHSESNWLLFWTFLKIGSTAFGGFMALISVVQNYLVDRKNLLSHDEVLNGISLATILPGPIAVNFVAYAGYKINGVLGAVVCATAVIIPSFLLILIFSYVYFNWGEIPAVNNVFKGLIPAVAAVIVYAAINMWTNSIDNYKKAMLSVLAFSLLVFISGFYITLAAIVLSGLIGLLVFSDNNINSENSVKIDYTHINKLKLMHSSRNITYNNILSVSFFILLVFILVITTSDALLATRLLATFASMSVFMFGGGFVFIPLMQEVIVDTLGWVNHKQFIDGIAIGQITPGPILISATFIGYNVLGVPGAILATLGIFGPPALLTVVCAHYLEKMKSSKYIMAALVGIRSAVVGMIAAAALIVVQTAEQNYISLIIFAVSLLLLIRFRLEVAWIIPAAGLVGYLLY